MRRPADPLAVFFVAVAVVAGIACAVALLWALSMEARAGTCPWPPAFGGAGVICTASNEAIECRCDECLQWDPCTDCDSYDVQRTDMDGTVHVWHIPPGRYVDDAGNASPLPPIPVWCPAKHDGSMPFEGRTYKYAVRACVSATGQCSALTGQHIYIGAPYAIGSFRPPVQAN